MKIQSIANTSLAALALGAAAVIIAPGQEAAGFGTLPGTLSAESQRDFRVFNNFADAAANDNTTADAQFPGFDGAEMANWKAGVEWGSDPHGLGTGDPLQTNLGDGGANFDFIWAGNATGIGGTDSNILSGQTSCGGGGTLAYTETPISDGWRIRYCDEWTWFDGPGDSATGGNNFDMQGIGCHELGHSLGLDHSGVSGATMAPATSASGSSNQRSINSDDIAGVQFKYGVESAGKPEITGFSVSGSTLTITGSNFSATNGQVWFTSAAATPTAGDPLIKVTGVSSSGGGTVISVTIPAGTGVGDIAVKQSTTGHATLSNAFPYDGVGGGGPTLSITFVIPSTIENLVPGTAETVFIFGTGFTPATTIEIDGNPIAGSFTQVDSTSMTFEWEPLATLGAHTLSVEDGAQSDSTPITVSANALPTIQVGNGDPLNIVSGSASIVLAGPPGQLNYLMVSDSDIPSVLPGKFNLSMGNFFQQLNEVGLFIIGANGLATTSVPLSGVTNTFLYWQGLRVVLPLASNYPLLETNLQSTFTP